MQPLWKTVWRFLKKLKIELPYDPVIPLLSLYADQIIIWKDICTPMFIAWQHHLQQSRLEATKCPSTDEWIKKRWYVCVCVCVCIDIHIYIHTVEYGILLSHKNNGTMEYYSTIKKEWNNAITATWTDVDIIILNVVIRQRWISYDITYMCHLKYDPNISTNRRLRQKQTQRYTE